MEDGDLLIFSRHHFLRETRREGRPIGKLKSGIHNRGGGDGGTKISFSMARGKFVERSLTAYCERGKEREREREKGGGKKNVSIRENVQRSFVLLVTRSKSFMRARPNHFDFLFLNLSTRPAAAFPRIFLVRVLISLSTAPFTDYHIYERVVSLLLRRSPRKIVFERRAGVV